MPLPEGYLPREGDILTFRAQVRHNVDPGETIVHVTPPGRPYSNMVLPLEGVVDLHSRHWDVGADVCVSNDIEVAKVMAVDGDAVWVKFNSGTRATYRANDLIEAQPDVGPETFGLPEITRPREPDSTPAPEMLPVLPPGDESED